MPALITGILTIGLNVFALATDASIAELWRKVRRLHPLADPTEAAVIAIDKPARLALSLTGAEALALSVVSGGALYFDIEHAGENLHNMWHLILRIAGVIPKLFFSKTYLNEFFWYAVGAIVAGQVAGDTVRRALPVIGQWVAVGAVMDDVATLVEVGAETMVSPWVIENEVSLTYPVRVSVSRDPRSSTFPATARSWRLEALVDGAVGSAPVTGTVNERGRLRSDPLVLEVSAPFAGRTIQWSIVVLDYDGFQVATGVSEQYRNDDPAHPAGEVAFAITQIPATISARTVFRRSATTTYDPAVGGYSWSDQVTVAGTVLSGGALDVAGAAVATLAGVAGVVWK